MRTSLYLVTMIYPNHFLSVPTPLIFFPCLALNPHSTHQDTLSNDRMGKHIIRFSQNSAIGGETSPGATTTPPPSCVAKTCDTNGCNAQVPFFHLRKLPSSSVPTQPTEPTATTTDWDATSPINQGGDLTTRSAVSTIDPDSAGVTRVSSSLVDLTTTAPSSATSQHNPPFIPKAFFNSPHSLVTWLLEAVLPLALLRSYQALVLAVVVCFA